MLVNEFLRVCQLKNVVGKIKKELIHAYILLSLLINTTLHLSNKCHKSVIAIIFFKFSLLLLK